MSSRGKKKTTMAKLNREAKQRERRNDKQARKVARRDAAANPPDDGVLVVHGPPVGAASGDALGPDHDAGDPS